MTDPVFRIKLWGTRGSLPVAGSKFRKFGGNTICFEVRCGDEVLLFDAGSGLLPAGDALKSEGRSQFSLFFSHFHYDHVIGLPFFVPLYDRTASLRVWSGHTAGKMTTHEMFDAFMRPPFFPIGPDQCSANIDFRDFRAGDAIAPYDGITVRTTMLNHPGGAIGYRIEFAGRVVAIVTDTEHAPGKLDPGVLDLISDADLFLYDANFDDTEMERFRGFGHSSWQHAIRLAKAAGARRVGFIHHAIWRTDAELAAIGRKAAKQFPGAFCGRDYQVIDI